MKPPVFRRQWLLDYLAAKDRMAPGAPRTYVDVLNRYFVNAYVDATGAPADAMPYGADKCPMWSWAAVLESCAAV